MYIGTSINESPVIAAQAGEAITGGALLAVSMDADGVKVVDTAGAVAVGILIQETDDVAAGDTVTVQVKDMGLWKTGDAVAPGDLLMSDDAGKAVKADDGGFIFAQALEAATAADQVIRVQIIKAGFAAVSTDDDDGGGDEGNKGDNT